MKKEKQEIEQITHDFGREDLNLMRDTLNMVIRNMNE